MKDEFTASCTLITDKNNNQINGFHPAAMGFPCEYAFPHPDASADWGIVSPGNLDDMKALPRLFREKASGTSTIPASRFRRFPGTICSTPSRVRPCS